MVFYFVVAFVRVCVEKKIIVHGTRNKRTKIKRTNVEKLLAKRGASGTKGETEKHFCIPPKSCLNVPHKWHRQATTTPNFASKCTDTIFLNFALHDDNYYCHREFPKFNPASNDHTTQRQQLPGQAKQNQKPPVLAVQTTQQHHHTTTSSTGRRYIGTQQYAAPTHQHLPHH